MDDPDQPREPGEAPNVILRGGPFDGDTASVTGWHAIVREVGGDRHLYRPTGEVDDEYPTLGVYAYAGAA